MGAIIHFNWLWNCFYPSLLPLVPLILMICNSLGRLDFPKKVKKGWGWGHCEHKGGSLEGAFIIKGGIRKASSEDQSKRFSRYNKIFSSFPIKSGQPDVSLGYYNHKTPVCNFHGSWDNKMRLLNAVKLRNDGLNKKGISPNGRDDL